MREYLSDLLTGRREGRPATATDYRDAITWLQAQRADCAHAGLDDLGDVATVLCVALTDAARRHVGAPDIQALPTDGYDPINRLPRRPARATAPSPFVAALTTARAEVQELRRSVAATVDRVPAY